MKKKWNSENFEKITYKLYLNGYISCKEYLDYTFYPLSKNEFDGLILRDVFDLIGKKKGLIPEKSTINNDSINLILSEEVTEIGEEVTLTLSLNNALDIECVISDVMVDVWASKFNLMGSYTFKELENPIIPPERSIINTLYIPKSILDEDISIIDNDLHSMDYSCLTFIINSYKSNCF